MSTRASSSKRSYADAVTNVASKTSSEQPLSKRPTVPTTAPPAVPRVTFPRVTFPRVTFPRVPSTSSRAPILAAVPKKAVHLSTSRDEEEISDSEAEQDGEPEAECRGAAVRVSGQISHSSIANLNILGGSVFRNNWEFLQPAKKSDLNRKRMKTQKPPKTGKRKVGLVKKMLKPEYVAVRIAEYTEEPFIEQPEDRLFCKSCRMAVDTKKSAVNSHVTSTRHVTSKILYRRNKENKGSIYQHVRDKESSGDRYWGEGLTVDTVVDRMAVTQSFLATGISLNKLRDDSNGLLGLLEAATGNLCIAHMYDLVSEVHELEIVTLKKELKKAGPITLIFDGTTDVCEVVALVARWVDTETNRVQQRLLCADMYEKSMTGEDLTVMLHEQIVKYEIAAVRIVGYCRDGASVNSKAVNLLSGITRNSEDIVCTCHAACLAGTLLSKSLGNASKLVSKYSSMLSRSNIAMQAMKATIGKRPATKSMVRWGSEYNVADEIFVYIDHLKDLVNNNDHEFAAELRQSIREMLSEHGPLDENGLNSLQRIKLELALYKDFGECIFQFVYGFEGDGFLTPLIYARMTEVCSRMESIVTTRVNCPRLHQTVEAITPDVGRQQQLLQVFCAKAAPARDKFISCFLNAGGSCARMMQTYKCLSILAPHIARDLNAAQRTDYISRIANTKFMKYLDSAVPGGVDRTINRLTEELPRYLQLAAGYIHQPQDILSKQARDLNDWWIQIVNDLPAFKSVYNCGLLLQPSSAAAERVFSMIRCMFDDRQEGALIDYKEGAVMTRYNQNMRLKL
jgi:protein-arginine kinase activator protein McsA